MKLNGIKLKSVNKKVIPIVREGDGTLYFQAYALNSYDEFNSLLPTEPTQIVAGTVGKKDVEEVIDEKVVQDRMSLFYQYIVIASLLEVVQTKVVKDKLNPQLGIWSYKTVEHCTKIEWETVELNKPETWANWEKELLDAGLSPMEVRRIYRNVLEANSLSEQAVEEALENFLTGVRERVDLETFLKEDHGSIQSGEPVSDLESSPQE